MLSDQDLTDLAAGLKMLEQYLPKAHRATLKVLAELDTLTKQVESLKPKKEDEAKRQAAMTKVLAAMTRVTAAKDALNAYHQDRNTRAAGGAIVPFDPHGLVKHRNELAEAERALKWARSEAAAQGYRIGRQPNRQQT